MTIGFSYNLKDPATGKTDLHAEYETVETLEAITEVLSRHGSVIHLPCDNTFLDRIISAKPDVVFNIAEGWGGRDRESFVPVVCAMLGIPCTGSDAVALGVTMDKALTKRLLRDAGVHTTSFELCDCIPESYPHCGFPAFVKPNCDGSSRGINSCSLVEDFESYQLQLDRIINEYKTQAIVEPYLNGKDYCVALIGNNPPRTLPTCEVLLGHVSDIPFFSWEYKQCNTDRLDISPGIDKSVLFEMEEMSLIAWDILGLRDYSRIDFRTDMNDVPFLLEINALPGLSPVSGIFIQQAKKTGMTFEDIIDAVLERALAESSGGMTGKSD